MPRGAVSLFGDHDDDSVPISQDAASVENKNDSATPRPAKKKQKVEKEGNSSVPISQVDDKRDRAAFERWCRLIQKDGYEYGDYKTVKEKERRFKYFKKSLHRDREDPLLIKYGTNVFQFADRSPKEFKLLTDNVGKLFSYVSDEILDEWEEILREPVEDFSCCGCGCACCDFH
ncbi:hypothetical protein QL285_007726 [Trifolium repens]|nr:hypothetical protein QL285_007726 [Trifolium repens]